MKNSRSKEIESVLDYEESEISSWGVRTKGVRVIEPILEHFGWDINRRYEEGYVSIKDVSEKEDRYALRYDGSTICSISVVDKIDSNVNLDPDPLYTIVTDGHTYRIAVKCDSGSISRSYNSKSFVESSFVERALSRSFIISGKSRKLQEGIVDLIDDRKNIRENQEEIKDDILIILRENLSDRRDDVVSSSVNNLIEDLNTAYEDIDVESLSEDIDPPETEDLNSHQKGGTDDEKILSISDVERIEGDIVVVPVSQDEVREKMDSKNPEGQMASYTYKLPDYVAYCINGKERIMYMSKVISADFRNYISGNDKHDKLFSMQLEQIQPLEEPIPFSTDSVDFVESSDLVDKLTKE